MEKDPLLKKTDNSIIIRYVDSTMSNDLLYKFPDYSGFGFDYSQSALWSPLVPRFHSLSCLNTNNSSPDFKKKISFDGDNDCGGVNVGCNGLRTVRFSGFKRKVCDFGSKFNGKFQKKKVLKFEDKISPLPKKGWTKALKMTSKQFKKTKNKKKDHQIHHRSSSRITLADYLQCQNL